MILQALAAYYERKKDSGELAPEGFEPKEIPFVLVLHADGTLAQIEDTRSLAGKKKVGRVFLMPQAVKKTSGVSANLLWDTAEYVLGVDTRGKPERVAEQHEAFKLRVRELAARCEDQGLAAVLRFLDHPELPRLEQEADWKEIRETNPVLSFRLISDRADCLVSHRAAVLAALQGGDAQAAGPPGLCLVSGERVPVARLHPAIKGVWGAQMAGANIVSFNLPAFNSFGKEQGDNAQVGEPAAFAYTTALNHLLRRGSSQRLQVGDASTVFWSAGPSSFADEFAALFAEPGKDDPDRGTAAVRNLYAAMHNGVYGREDGNTRFYVLGLAPNAARISIAFWKAATVQELAVNILRHFDDIEIVRPSYARPYLSLFRLLTSAALLGKIDNVAPNLAANLTRAVLDSTPYPASLLQAAIRRCRAERELTYARAALIKGCINRSIRSGQLTATELHMSLDRDNKDPAYCLGRLFATLERIQGDAQPGINATIRDRYYGAASSSPASVFPGLLRLKNHHLAKIKPERPGIAAWLERLVREIFSGLEAQALPARLTLAEQGLFAIGYYHQQQDFYAGKAGNETLSISEATSGEHQ